MMDVHGNEYCSIKGLIGITRDEVLDTNMVAKHVISDPWDEYDQLDENRLFEENLIKTAIEL